MTNNKHRIITKEDYFKFFKEEEEKTKKWMLSPMEQDDIVQHAYEAINDGCFTEEDLKNSFPNLF